MSKAFKCDRCGKYFESEPCNPKIIVSNGVRCNLYCRMQKPDADDAEELQLCVQCNIELVKWFNQFAEEI